MRDVVLGGLPSGVTLTRRAKDKLIEVRADLSGAVDPTRLVLQRIKREWRLWTWAGMSANRTLAAWVPELADQSQKVSDLGLRLHGGLTIVEIQQGLTRAARSQETKPLPNVPLDVLRGLKFSAALPNDLAIETLANRTADVNGALSTLLMRSVTHET
jgi:ATP-dependent Lhr-like helicase